MRRTTLVLLAVACLAGAAAPLLATTDCTFTTKGSKWELDADCTTDETIYVPDGMTLFGKNRRITAVDPVGGFKGGVVQNAGSFARVEKLEIDASGLMNLCKGGADRLRGIMFEAGSGSIVDNLIVGVNKGASGCQEGNAIEVRNAPFDGSHPGTEVVTVSGNKIYNYQKTGIVANGDVMVKIDKNTLGASATQMNLAANTIQMGFGAQGTVDKNQLEGNQWFGPSNFAASAILIYLADMVDVEKNHVRGNSDIGLYIFADNGNYEKNDLRDQGPDGGQYDIGIGNYGTGNTLTKNKVRGFDTPYQPPLAAAMAKALAASDLALPHPFK